MSHQRIVGERKMKNNLRKIIVCAEIEEATATFRLLLDLEDELRFMKCQIEMKPCWKLIDKILGEEQ